MKRLLRAIIFICFFIGGAQAARASHMMGSDLGFKSLGGSKYRVILKLYRDCRGDTVSGNIDSLYCFAGNNGALTHQICRLKLIRTSILDVTPVCKDSVHLCAPGSFGKGIEEHTFITDFDLSQAPFSTAGLGSSNCELTVAFYTCCRNVAITTGPAATAFWTRATLNICNLQRCSKKWNNTVQFTAIPYIPATCNSKVYYSLQTLDTMDYDSVGYGLLPALNGASNNPVTYSSPFSYQYPLTPYCVPSGVSCIPNPKTNPPRGFYFDTMDGYMVFTPTKCDEVAVLAVGVKEYRRDSIGNWVLVSAVRREIQMEVSDPDYNNAPTIAGPTVNKVCEGDKICFDIDGKDATFTPFQTIPDTVTLTWNGGIPGATFVVKNPLDREKTAQFCWQTKIGQSSDVAYSFTITATDNHCPKPLYGILGFKVMVNQKPFAERRYTCMDSGFLRMQSRLPANFKGVATYKWSVRDSLGLKEIFYATVADTIFRLPYYGKFVVVHTINNSDNCPTLYRDTVYCYDQLGSVHSVHAGGISAHPNPVTSGEYLYLDGLNQGAFELMDIGGRKIISGLVADQKIRIPDAIIPGMYLLRFPNSNYRPIHILVGL